MTHQYNANVAFNFEFDNTSMTYGDAIKEAFKLAFGPNFHSVLNGVRLTGVVVSDPEGAGNLMTWGED